jgi:hypothetical protein
MLLTLFDKIWHRHAAATFSDAVSFVIPQERRAGLLARLPGLDAFQRQDRLARPWTWPDVQ